MLGLFLGLATRAISYVRKLFSPAELFANNEQGAWYDPSDLTTMFQDAAGTTPVTAAEQPVGLILDKSKGLVLGPEFITQPYSVTGTSWTSSGTQVSRASGGALTNGAVNPTVVATAGKTYLITFAASGLSGATCYFNFGGNSSISAVTKRIATAGSYRFVVTAATTGGLIFVPYEGTDFAITIDNISVRELPGNHASQATATKRPILKLIAGKYSLLFDGIDDALVTGSIDFTATDKMTVFAGVRKLSDAATGMLFELSNSVFANTGSMNLLSPSGALPNYQLTSGGTVLAAASPSGYASPISNVLTGITSIETDVVKMRVNGVQAATSATDQGTGNYGNYPLYIGSRAGTGLPFNGHIYSLIVRGAQSTDAQITSAETWVNDKTGAY